MKKLIALTTVSVAILSSSVFAGEQIADKNPKNPVVPPTPVSYYRANEFDISAFGDYALGFGRKTSVGNHAWGGGLGLSYFFTRNIGISLSGEALNEVPGDLFGGTVLGDLIFRLPLDTNGGNFHLAPYVFAGGGGLFDEHVGFGQFVSDVANVRRNAVRRDRRGNNLLGEVGGGLEYRFTPHIGIFGEARQDFLDAGRSNYFNSRFGIRYAF